MSGTFSFNSLINVSDMKEYRNRITQRVKNKSKILSIAEFETRFHGRSPDFKAFSIYLPILKRTVVKLMVFFITVAWTVPVSHRIPF